MPNIKTTTPKFPCGICGIGVKYSGIKCSGCQLWYHGACVNITSKDIKKLVKEEGTNNWMCTKCSHVQPTHNIQDNTNSISNYTTQASRNPNIDEIQNAVQNFNTDENDLETSLTLAAEVGNALLAENAKLKQEIHDLSLTNAKLSLQIVENKSETEYEEKLERLTIEAERMLTRNNSLTETVNYLEKQLKHERSLRSKLQSTFEELDREREETILKNEHEISKLKQNIQDLKTKILKGKQDDKGEIPLKHRDAEVQTNQCNTPLNCTSPLLVTELTKIKLKQEQMEHTINSLINQSNAASTDTLSNRHQLNPNKHIAPSPQTLKNSKYKNVTKKNFFSISMQNAKYRAWSTTSSTEGKERDSLSLRNKPKKTPRIEDNNTQNHFHPLVQLKRPKYNKCTEETLTSINSFDTSPLSDNDDHHTSVVEVEMHRPGHASKQNSQNQLDKFSPKKHKPPLNSKVLGTDQTVEDFFTKNIQFYKEVMDINNIETAQIKNQAFLEATHRNRSKMKETTKPGTAIRIFTNSKLKQKRQTLLKN